MSYDLKDLGNKLKGRGLELAEDSAKIVAEEVLSWISESAQASDSKVDDLFAVVIPMIKPHILSKLDRIDGQEG
jgi:hypothetical protein